MSQRGGEPGLRPGKLPPELLREVLADGPEPPPEVVVGPTLGEDACAILLPGGEDNTLIAATDPITLTGEDVGALAVAINANDVAVMGAAPRWFLAFASETWGPRLGWPLAWTGCATGLYVWRGGWASPARRMD